MREPSAQFRVDESDESSVAKMRELRSDLITALTTDFKRVRVRAKCYMPIR